MRKTKTQFIFGMVLLMMISCKKKSNDPAIQPEPIPVLTCNVVNVTPGNTSVTISTPTTWANGNVYVIKANVNIASVLTIEPGAIIKLDGASISINNLGRIVANGTATNKITFTSIADDTKCGDSNGDGTASQALKGDWKGLYINSGTSNSFLYCDFLFGGKATGGATNVIEIGPNGSAFTFDHCEFAHTLSNGVSVSYAFAAPFDYMSNPTLSIFTNNFFYDNDRPISLDVRYTLNTNNVFHDPKNSSIKNARNGVFMHFFAFDSGAVASWNITEVPYIMEGQCSAYKGGILNIGANVIVKFVSVGDKLASYSGSVVLNPSAILTSYKDDAHGGDANGDGASTTPTSGDWSGHNNTVPGNTTWIHSANILYAAN
jgi:hypothetical protein